MKVPKRYLKKEPDFFKVVGLSFKPQKTETETEEKLTIGFKIGDWDDPINIVSYFQSSEHIAQKVH